MLAFEAMPGPGSSPPKRTRAPIRSTRRRSRVPAALVVGAAAVIILGALAAVLVVVLGGDGEGGEAASPGATPTRSTDEWGPAPELGGNVTGIMPGHRGQVRQALTRETQQRTGVCAEVNYEDLPQNQLWFRMAVDDREVTPELILFLRGTRENPEGATICYQPKEGLTPGIHSAAVVVQDPNSRTAPPKQVVAWKFEVIP